VELPAGELDADSLPAIRERFEHVYRGLFGRTGPDVPLEGVSWRVLATGPRPAVNLRAGPPATSGATAADALKGQRGVYFPDWEEPRPTPVYDRYLLSPGASFDGPAVVEERESTTIVGLGARVEVDESRNLSVWL
jgi:N-methylhydantoinase A/oxoprolinase/acetone carboxylase beta subunit